MSLEFWSKFTEKLESKLTQEEFNTWVRPLKGNLNDKTLEITAPNDFVLNYVMQNLSDEITNTINKEIKGNISLVYKTLDKETFVDKYQSKQAKPQTKLVDSYIFDSFVEGKSNHVALAAAKQVASNPSGDYNPLFIYGGVGLGKTHLMHAVGNEILKESP
ncbi:MAG TPA: chromosomal replication initiator protein DnaA, partial [Planctomycetaceae bacterium]|nr:chromosomal replication initiator protein DnaA [Planctomycetaceae bacterium]